MSNNTKTRLQNIKHTEPQQKYRIGTIRNIKLLGGGGGLKPVLQDPNIALSFCSGSVIYQYKQEQEKSYSENIIHRYQHITCIPESRASSYNEQCFGLVQTSSHSTIMFYRIILQAVSTKVSFN